MCQLCENSYSQCLDCGTIHKNRTAEYEYTSDYFVGNINTQIRIDNRLKSLLYRDIKILDYGGGTGRLTNQLKRCYNIDYYEPSKCGQKLAREQYNLKSKIKGKYDLIILIDVIEHFKNPKKEITKITKLLKTKGVIYLETPNASDIIARIRKRSWQQIHTDHTYLFTPKAIKKLFKQYNTKVITPIIIHPTILYWLCYIKNKIQQRPTNTMGNPIQWCIQPRIYGIITK